MKDKRYIDQEELKSLQLSILDEVSSFCENKGLAYFLGYGTLIGAIRHKGYIPWDDDIDIVMPRPDYDKFIASFNDSHQIIKVAEYGIEPNYTLPFAKVHDTRTIMHETMYKENGLLGVYIDVFPLDGWGGINQLRKIKRLSMYLNAKKAVIDNQRSFMKNAIITIGKIILSFISVSSIVRLMDKTAREYDYSYSAEVKSFFSVYGKKEVCKKEMLKETIFADFEGKKYRIPKNYDSYLKGIYGEYMRLPPEDKRKSTHVFEAWWK